MESVFSLIEYLLCMFLKYLVCYLLFPVGWQAMKDYGILFGNGHELIIDLIILKATISNFHLRLLAHRGPYICNEHICILGSLKTILAEAKATIVLGPFY